MKNSTFLRRTCYRGVLLCCFLFCSSAAGPRFALILSGGGARGLAQIGVLKAMEANNIKPDLIVATSMGAIIGALYAAGYSADSIESLARMVDWNKIFSNSSHRKTLFVSQKKEPSSALFELRFNYHLKPILPTSLSYGQSFYELLAPLLIIPQSNAGFDFDSLPIPLRIIATDLLSGNKVVFSEGNICTAIRASCSVPLRFSPVETNNHSTLLIDGGVSANIPVETARQMGAEVVVVIDVTSPFAKKEELDNPVKLVDQIMAIGVANQKEREKSQADMVITPDLHTIKNNAFEKIDSLITFGFRSTNPLCDSIVLLLHTAAASSAAVADTGGLLPESLHHQEPSPAGEPSLIPLSTRPNTPAPIIRGTLLRGNLRTSDRVLINGSGIRIGDTATSSLIQKAISSLYATDLFKNVNLDIDSAGTCRMMVEEKEYWRVRMGLRFDEFHLGEGYLEPAYENCFGLGIIALLHLQFGLRREKYAVEVHGNQFFSRNFASNIQLQIYSSKEKIQEKIQEVVTIIGDSATMISTTSLNEHTLRKTGLSLYGGTQLGRITLLSGGMRLERFMVQQKDADMLGDLLGTGFKNFLPYFSIKLTMDSMDKYPYATSGIRQFLSIGGASKALGGKYTFLKCSGSIGRFFTIFRYHTFFPQFSFSWASDALPLVERPYLGGAVAQERYQEMSVYNYTPFYGLPPRAVTGDMFGICHFEYRCEMKKNLFAHLLFDWGTAWDKGRYDYQELISDAPLGIGVGLSYMTLLGPFRFSYGQLLKNSEHYLMKRSEFFYFSGGYDF